LRTCVDEFLPRGSKLRLKHPVLYQDVLAEFSNQGATLFLSAIVEAIRESSGRLKNFFDGARPEIHGVLLREADLEAPPTLEQLRFARRIFSLVEHASDNEIRETT
jgi:hypothetical protein